MEALAPRWYEMLSTLWGVNSHDPPGGIGPELPATWSKTTVTVSLDTFFHVTVPQHVDTSHFGWNPSLVTCTVKPLSKFGSGLTASCAACEVSFGDAGGVAAALPPPSQQTRTDVRQTAATKAKTAFI